MVTEALALMMVKTFVADHPEIAEKKVNEWLNRNKVKLHHVGQSQSEKGGKFIFVLSLFYSVD
ncbi:MAG TPA: hypothetical protein VNR87_00440 [Flavisolibacter sp.]|nr:hypothetical protein [Flavisolibacter sp.]